jgi:serine/threonine protein phosphatase PrpC
MIADEQHNRDELAAAPADAEPAWWDDGAEAPAQASAEDTRPLDQTVVPDDDQIELASSSEPPAQQAGLYAAALRDVGRLRQINQDHVYTCVTSLPRQEQDMLIGLFVVADGMGGHEGGEIASRIAISTVARHILGELVVPVLDDTFGAALQPLVVEAVREANRAIWDQARIQGSDMGTTCTAILVVGRTMYIGHVGDSRAYLLTGGQLQQLTSDHSAVGRLIQLGQLDPSEAREHPMRSQLYRTVGQQPDVHVDFIQRPLGQSSHLMLCSDGLWSMLDDGVIQEALASGAAPPGICRALVDAANEAGGEDNISLVVIAL